jgi:hypothetical protein
MPVRGRVGKRWRQKKPWGNGWGEPLMNAHQKLMSPHETLMKNSATHFS